MAWTDTDYTIISYGGTDYRFAPTELVWLGGRDSMNQVVAESSSGQRKISTLDSNFRLTDEFAVVMMPESDRSVGGTTLRGFSTLKNLIETSVIFRQNQLTWKPPGYTVIAGTITGRFDASTFPRPKKMLNGGGTFYGDGSDILVFRKDH